MKYLLLIAIFFAPLSAELSKTEIIKQLTAESALHQQNNSKLKDSGTRKAKTTSSIEYNNDTYEDVAIYNLIKKDDRSINAVNNDNVGKDENFLVNNKKLHDKKVLEYLAMKEKSDQRNSKKQEDKIYNLSGYCSVSNNVVVQRMQAYSVMDCRLDENELGIENTQMFASFVPIFNKLALIGKPIYLRQGSRKIPINNGVILTVDQTNLNLATFINDVKIKNLLADMAITTNDIAYTTSMDYLEQKKQSDTQEKLSAVASPSGTSIVKATNTKAPDTTTYLTIAGIQLLSSFVNILGNFYKDNNYPLYKIQKQTEFYVDFNIKIKGNKNSLINYRKESYKNINIRNNKNYLNMSKNNGKYQVSGR